MPKGFSGINDLLAQNTSDGSEGTMQTNDTQKSSHNPLSEKNKGMENPPPAKEPPKNDTVISFEKCPTMPAPWYSEDKGEAWIWGDYIVILQKHPITVNEMLAAMTKNKSVKSLRPAADGIRYLYAMTLFYKKGCNPAGVDSARPAMVLTIEQADVGSFCKILNIPIPKNLECDSDGWDKPTFCKFIPNIHLNFDTISVPVTRENVKNIFFDHLSKIIEGERKYIGNIQDALKIKNDVSSEESDFCSKGKQETKSLKKTISLRIPTIWGLFGLFLFFGIIGAVLFFNSDYWAWESIRATEKLSSYRAYLKNNPDGQYRANAQKKISELQDRKYKLISTPRFTPSGVQDFLTEFPEYGVEKLDKLFYEDVVRSQDITYMRSYLEAFPSGQYADQVREDIRSFEQKLWAKNRNSRDENNLQQIMSQIQDNAIRTQIQNRITALYKDFAFVSQKDTKAAYERFIQLCPNAPECLIAKKRIIDIEVAEIAKGKHGTFSGSTPTSYSFGDTATIEIKNNTQYSITVRYSGPDSIKVELAPNARQTITIRTGSYKIAVSTSGGRVHPFYGTNEIRAGHYTESFYIRTSRY